MISQQLLTYSHIPGKLYGYSLDFDKSCYKFLLKINTLTSVRFLATVPAACCFYLINIHHYFKVTGHFIACLL